PGAAMAAHSPHLACHFLVEAGFARIGFTRVQLPRMERDVIRYREGSDPVETARLLPGPLRLGECLLERGVIPPDQDFFRWISAGSFGQAERRDLVVKLLNADHEPTLTWRLRDAFPVALDWSPLEAQGGGVLIESLRLAVGAMTVEAP
ncbi:MAG TPA: phage tail protein, partial [Geothrix sp.]|nr:phage tail protein [Geothrix sp.]